MKYIVYLESELKKSTVCKLCGINKVEKKGETCEECLEEIEALYGN